jgi:type I restriction enzyme R subunit/putative DNA methylase
MGWYSRGYVPHFDCPEIYQSITYRLDDSLPQHVLDELQIDLDAMEESDFDVEKRKRIEEYLDAGYGSCSLSDPRIAKQVEDTFLKFDSERYNLIEWSIMPNHVHVLIETIQGHTLNSVLHSWRSYTAGKANKILGRTGRFWARGKFDRFIRDEVHYDAVSKYIRMNPVKAGLVAEPEEWEFSSAAWRANK